MTRLRELFPRPGAPIGMLHLAALPGTPYAELPLAEVVEGAVREACVLAEAGFEGLIIENMGDRPYLRGAVGPEVACAMTAAGVAVRRAVPDLPLGVQVLAGANEASLAVALACGADFVRVEGFVFSAVADEGLQAEAAAGPLLRYRRSIGAEDIAVLCDIKKKHAAHAVTADVSLEETARAAAYFGAEGLVVTGVATGEPTAPSDLAAAAKATELPVFVGSGTTAEQVPTLIGDAAGFIVGSALKRDGSWEGELEPARAEAFVQAVRAARAEG